MEIGFFIVLGIMCLISLCFFCLIVSPLIVVLVKLIKVSRLKHHATSSIEGVVVDYKTVSGNYLTPVVEYEVDGQKYSRAKDVGIHYLGKKKKKGEVSVIRNDEGKLERVPRDDFLSETFAKKKYPIGSSVKVYYNPKKPEMSYVDNLPNVKTMWRFELIWSIVILVLVLVFVMKILGSFD